MAKVLSCDHTFKTSKHVGVTREDDGKFVCQYQNVFLGLNENGEVLTWRFTKSTASSEIEDLLKELKTRFDRQGGSSFGNDNSGRLLSCKKSIRTNLSRSKN